MEAKLNWSKMKCFLSYTFWSRQFPESYWKKSIYIFSFWYSLNLCYLKIYKSFILTFFFFNITFYRKIETTSVVSHNLCIIYYTQKHAKLTRAKRLQPFQFYSRTNCTAIHFKTSWSILYLAHISITGYMLRGSMKVGYYIDQSN